MLPQIDRDITAIALGLVHTTFVVSAVKLVQLLKLVQDPASRRIILILHRRDPHTTEVPTAYCSVILHSAGSANPQITAVALRLRLRS
jgi:hypothetical protein